MIIVVKYSIGFGSQTEEIEVNDDTSEDEIESIVQDMVTERLDWSWQRKE